MPRKARVKSSMGIYHVKGTVTMFACPLFAFLLAMVSCVSNESKRDAVDRIVVAYVTSWSDVIPDASDITHINYAFGHVTNTFDSVRVDNPDRLRMLVGLKEENPDLKVNLSVGGWGSGNFSEMAADSLLRQCFAQSCKTAIDTYGLDGIDIDWEYPTQGESAGISESPEDTDNFTLLIRDIRQAIGDDYILSIATIGSGEYIDFPAVLPYLSYVNIMSYDLGNPPYHHSALYCSESIAPHNSVSGCVEKHITLGVPREKIVMGMPMYNRGHREVLADSTVVIMWDDTAKVPYAVMCDTLALGMDDVRSIAHKCQYIIDNGLHGAMYWEYSSEKDPDRPMIKTVKAMILD